MKQLKFTRFLAMFLAIVMMIGSMPIESFATENAALFSGTKLYDTTVSGDYFKVISADTYALAPGAQEHEIVLNNAAGNDRKAVHVFEVDTYNEELEVMPGYWAIDTLDPDNLALEGEEALSTWKAMELTKTVAYYEDTLGYNVVGAMNTALAYDSNAPYGYMVWNGVVLGTPEIHKGAQTYLAINKDGSCELRSMSTPLTGEEQTAISANFGWLVKNGVLQTKAVERTSSDASRSMIGIKEDGTLVFCQVDGRNGAVSSGLSNYEMGEMMLALGCVNAVNCDGGGSSTFISKRAGEAECTMRSVPSDGSERPTINSVILVSTAGASGEFAKVVFDTPYDYIAPGASMEFEVTGLDTKEFIMDIPGDVIWQVAEDGMGTIENGIFTAGNTTGTATIQAVYNGNIVGEKVLNVVHPDTFGFVEEATVIPYGKSIDLLIETAYGADNWEVCVDGAYTIQLDNEAAATLEGKKLTATSDETVAGVNVTVSYNPDNTLTDTLVVTYGKGSEILFDFEDGDISDWMGFDEAKQWSTDNGVNNTLVGTDPLAGQFSPNVDGYTSLSTATDGGKVKNGNHALAWTLDNTDADFAGWTYNVLFNVAEESVVLRDVANGKNATTLGMWLYIPEGATGLAFQSQLYVKNTDGTYACKQDHFMFTTVSGVRKNLNSCTEADIPQSRWVYASIDISKYDYLRMPIAKDEGNSRSPSFVRTYVKPTAPAVHTFYIDDITLDYSSAVDDRVAPTISDIQAVTADTSFDADGSTVKANAAGFSAKVSDEGSLNVDTAQIYVDGNKVGTQVSSGVMSTTNDVKLQNGSHVITFEIADNLGNYTQISANIIVDLPEEQGVVYVTGHNDSGEKPEYDSVYYVDIKTTDISKIENVEMNIKLNNANKWELEHMTVADGYSVEWEVMEADNSITTFAANPDIHSTDNVAIVTITKTGDCELTGEQVLASLPIRLWSWNGVDSVTGKEITREQQFASGNCPIVTVDYNVLFGCAETVDGEVVTFNGSDSVATMMNDNINPWHYHDEELTILTKEPTCTTTGYVDRTYCEGCSSIVDWGTVVPVNGHIYEVSDDELVCSCGAILSGNGLVTAGDKIYCLIADKLVTGWQMIGDAWCYAAVSTKEVQTGEFTVKGLTYTANEEGIVVKGAWVTDENGTKYSFGPEFYTRKWVEIDSKTYYFDVDGYMFTGIQYIPVNRNNMKEGIIWYEFAEDGTYIGKVNGFVDYNDLKYYVVDGEFTYGGLMLIDGYYYYARTSGEIVCDRSYTITKTNDLLPKACYTFDAEGKMTNPPVVNPPVEPEDPEVPVEKKNGICADENGKLWYYEDDVKTYGGLMLIDGYYYYARTSGEILCDRSYTITKTNGLLPKACYTFDGEGKMINPPAVKPETPDVSM